MTKIVINRCYGGFDLSYRAVLRYCEIKGIQVWAEEDPTWGRLHRYWLVPEADDRVDYDIGGDEWASLTLYERAAHNRRCEEQMLYPRDIPRDDPALVQTVEELGADSYGGYSELRVVEIPDDVVWDVDEYDGMEEIHERHRVWGRD